MIGLPKLRIYSNITDYRVGYEAALHMGIWVRFLGVVCFGLVLSVTQISKLGLCFRYRQDWR